MAEKLTRISEWRRGRSRGSSFWGGRGLVGKILFASRSREAAWNTEQHSTQNGLKIADRQHPVFINRRELTRLLRAVESGDTILVTRLDRLARSTRDLLNVLDQIAKVGATFRSFGDTWADTTTAHGRLMLTALGSLAEFERELIRVRTSEDRERAKARGVHMGRPPKLNLHQRREALELEYRRPRCRHVTAAISDDTAARLRADRR